MIKNTIALFAILIGLLVLEVGVIRGEVTYKSLEEADPSIFASALSGDNQIYSIYYRDEVTVTAYSSTPEQTWGDPFITASGERVRDGIVAANWLPFGTELRIPELFGDKVFIVKDRMHRRHTERLDIWFEETQDAINFGIQKAKVEII